MVKFFTLSWGSHIFITFMLGTCVLAQTIALVLSVFRHGLTKTRITENLFEISILLEILVFSLLYGQFVNGYINGFVVPTGYENIRVVICIIVVILSIIVFTLTRNLWHLGVVPTTLISLPIIENMLVLLFPWFFIGALIFFLIRSIKVCISNIVAIRTNISGLSVIHAVDTLHTGVLFSENDGYTLLSNHQMQKLMIAITGKIFRNSIQFYETLISDQYISRYKKAELDGQVIYILPNEGAWMFTKTNINFLMKNYIHISAADVTELWGLTAKLQLQDEELRHKSEELKRTIANLHILSKEREIDNAKMRAHDILGQRLSVLLRIIQNENNLDYELLTSLSKGLLAELKAEQNKVGPHDKLKGIQQIFAAIGVNIEFQGELPEEVQKACLFVDIIREGSTNAVRHGFATAISIKAESKESEYKLTINNNGYTTATPITPGNGIKVMRKKISAQGGNLDIIHHPVFTLSIVLPGGDKHD